MRILWISIALLASAGAAAGQTAGCVAVEGDRILAGDMAKAVAAFSSLPPDTELGYAPVPGVRRFFQTPELRRLALRYNLPLAANATACIERQMDHLRPELVAAAMRKGLHNPDAQIEIIELSRFPIPRGELEFDPSALPRDAAGAVIWRGIVRYAGGSKYGVWARAKVLVRGTRLVAKEDLVPGRPITAGQIAAQECDVYPAQSIAPPSMEEVIGRVPRLLVHAATPVSPAMLDAPRDVERGDVVQVEVHSGAAVLKLEGRAESPGRRGDAIKVHSLATGRSFSARVADKDRVVMTTAAGAKAKDTNP